MKKFLISLLCLLPACYKSERVAACKIKVIVFDFDGTLADTFLLSVKCANALAAEYGYKPLESVQDIEDVRKKGMREIVYSRLGLKFYQLPTYLLKAKKVTYRFLFFNGL